MRFKCTRTDAGDETSLVLEGVLDAATSPEFRPIVDKVVEEQRKQVVLDMYALREIDSSGVGCIVSLFKRLRALGGVVRIQGLRDQPRAIFRLLRLDRVFPV